VKRSFDEISHSTDDSNHKHFKLTVMAPGISASELEVVVKDCVLHVSGESQRTGACVERSFCLPREADLASASATHIDGVLTLLVPERTAVEPKQLAIGQTSVHDDDKMSGEGEEAGEDTGASK